MPSRLNRRGIKLRVDWQVSAYRLLVLLVLLLLLAAGCRKEAPDRAAEDSAAAQDKVTPERAEDAGLRKDKCIPVCYGRECGDNGCDGSCGKCPGSQTCDKEGKCADPPCVPACSGKECGEDGCGGSCGRCPEDRQCDDAGKCGPLPCTPDCIAKECGEDGCGGSCGMCKPGSTCRESKCSSEPCKADCSGRVCGDDGCGGKCGTCPLPDRCQHGRCIRKIAIGAFVGTGREPWDREPLHVGSFAKKLGKNLAVAHTYIGFPSDWSGDCAFGKFPKEFADEFLSVNPVGGLMVTLMPQCGFRGFVENFRPGADAYEATAALAIAASKFPGPVFLRFGHDMNTPWYSWGTCYFDNKNSDHGCVDKPETYRKAFANFTTVVREHSQKNTHVVWCPHEWEPYWGEHYSSYPQYDAFYPGDEFVDWVGLDTFYQDTDPPRPRAFVSRMEGFYERFASVRGHGKPMMIAETATECVIKEKLRFHKSLGDFDRNKSWWEGWGSLVTEVGSGSAPALVRHLRTGKRHIVFSAAAGEGGPHVCEKFYVGGTAFTLDWEDGMNFTNGNVILFAGKRDAEGEVPSLQIELCDVKAPECPKKNPCCDKGTLSATVRVESTDWELYLVPLSEFKPTVKGTSPSIAWRKLRAMKLHLLCDSKTGNLARLHVDGMALGKWNRRGASRCKRASLGWARQVFAPGQCYEWPNLKMILWYHDRKEKDGAVMDYRIPDFPAFAKLLSDRCFSGGFF